MAEDEGFQEVLRELEVMQKRTGGLLRCLDYLLAH